VRGAAADAAPVKAASIAVAKMLRRSFKLRISYVRRTGFAKGSNQ
jgi:hypothetical protein